MKDVGNDTWEFSFAKLDAPVQFTPTLDKTIARGPRYVLRPGETLDIYPHFFASKGNWKIRWEDFRSKVHPEPDGLGRPIEVYLPAGYDENTVARFPVVYMTDGQIVFGRSAIVTAAMGDMRVDETLDTANEAGTVAEVIVVAIDTPIDPALSLEDAMAARCLELTPTSAVDPTGKIKESGKGPEFLSMIVDELKPLVDAELRTLPARENTFMAGASLGGLMSAYAGIMHGDVFGGIVAFSPSAFWDSNYIVGAVKNAKAGPKRTSKVYADVGDAEIIDGDTSQIDSNKALAAAYLEAGYAAGTTVKTWVEPGAEHDGNFWAKRVPDAFAFVIGRGPGR